MNTLIFVSAFAGFGALCLSMERHAKQVFNLIPKSAYRLIASTLGWALLFFSLIQSVQNYGVSVGITAWFGALSLTATAIGLLLAYAPNHIKYLAPGILFIGAIFAYLF